MFERGSHVNHWYHHVSASELRSLGEFWRLSLSRREDQASCMELHFAENKEKEVRRRSGGDEYDPRSSSGAGTTHHLPRTRSFASRDRHQQLHEMIIDRSRATLNDVDIFVPHALLDLDACFCCHSAPRTHRSMTNLTSHGEFGK